MRVLFLQHQPCIRALKYAQGFRNRSGQKVELFFAYLNKTLTEFYGYGDELFKEFVKLDRKDPRIGVKDAVRNYDIDIIHSHNAPDFLTASAIKSVSNVPIIHDNHDVLSLRKTKYGIGFVGPDDVKVMETRLESAQNGSKKAKKRRSQDEKIGRRKWVIRTLKRQDTLLKRIDRRTRMLAAGLRELFILGEDCVSMVACEDEIDVALLNVLREAGAAGRQSGELAVQLDIDHRDVSRRVYRMNKRMEQEIGENIIEKHGHKWKLIPRLRRDFAAAR